jgi:hypothetical protein
VRGGEDGTGVGPNMRWQGEELDSMLLERKWGEGDGVRAELLAQKAIYRMENQIWRHPLTRIVAIWGEWRRRLWRG